jgi:Mlc titration factor MtfA (ptsG expression regulator)
MTAAMLWKSWRRFRAARKTVLPPAEWQALVAELPVFRGLKEQELERLRQLVILFLYEKAFEPVQGLQLTQAMRLSVAAQACLPILYLGLDYYRGWFSVILYPESFIVEHYYADQSGVVHRERHLRAGEAWQRGPLILSWAEVGRAGEGGNVVIHECAHKLDMLNGNPNGLPPLHSAMRVAEWAGIFTVAYQDLCGRAAAGLPTSLHPYACESPAEFFAVASEAFFALPAVMQAAYPQVYGQLRAFYRQDPLARLTQSVPSP